MLKLDLSSIATSWPVERALRAVAGLRTVRRPAQADRLERYAIERSSPESALLASVAEDTRRHDEAKYMLVGALQGQLLATLVHALRARNVLEVGTFTGYSALAMAQVLPPDGRLISCELDARRAETARRHIAASPHAHQVEVVVGPALSTIAGLTGPFELVFVDADKAGYVDYYEAVLPLLAPHGLIAVDNTLHAGLTAPDDAGDRQMIEAVLRFNDHVAADPRVEQVVLPLRDGLTLIRRSAGGPTT